MLARDHHHGCCDHLRCGLPVCMGNHPLDLPSRSSDLYRVAWDSLGTRWSFNWASQRVDTGWHRWLVFWIILDHCVTMCHLPSLIVLSASALQAWRTFKSSGIWSQFSSNTTWTHASSGNLLYGRKGTLDLNETTTARDTCRNQCTEKRWVKIWNMLK